jgi:hypothetical protein
VEPLLEHLARWRTMRNGYSPDFLESVCHALSHYPEERVVQDLGALLTATSRLPWRRCAPLALRRAALLALQRIGGDIAGSILKRCEADKDPWIRFRARTPARQPPAAPGRSPRLEKPPAGSGA